MDELYRTLGDAKCVELSKRSRTFWDLLQLSESRKNSSFGGAVREGIARDFVRGFLPPGLGLKSGLVFDGGRRAVSPQCDGIIYKGAPLLEFTDAVVVEKDQVQAIVEIKAWTDQGTLFGPRARGKPDRNPNRGLAEAFYRRKAFLPAEARYLLFVFQLNSRESDTAVVARLKEVCHDFAVVLRREPTVERKAGKEAWVYNFDHSVSRLIEWLRNLN